MSVVRSPVRSVVRSPVRGVFGSDSQTPLQRILSLSPSALWWPANGSGWQGTSGGTLAASGQPVGLVPDLAALGGKTLSEWLASAPELVTNGDFSGGVTTGWTTIAGTTFSVVSGAARVENAGAAAGAAYQTLTTVSGRAYRLRVTASNLSVTSTVRVTANNGVTPSFNGSQLATNGSTGTTDFIFVAAGASTTVGFYVNSTTAGARFDYDDVSVKELPGLHHLRAGTWASPSDAARPTLQVSGGASWIDPDATNDQMSFLTALSARAIVARVRVPAGYTADDRFLVNDAETVNVSVNSGNWTATGSGAIRIDGASGAAFTEGAWQTLTIEWASAQAFTRLWYSATGSQFGSMDIAALAVFNSALSAGDRNTAENVITAVAA